MAVRLQQLLFQRGMGITSVCSAHPLVIRAAFEQALDDGSTLLIEATCNQVNQYGGYTGMRPKDFRFFVERLGGQHGFPLDRLVLGGDHLGPNPWRHLPAADAMAEAEQLVGAYVAAGFTKIHLDASMSCQGDPHVLSNEEVAGRAARLAAAAERARLEGYELEYVIGTEVPTPGGATHGLDELQVTTISDAEETWEVHRSMFEKYGLTSAWRRILALVVQPGVEFSHDDVVNYKSSRASELTQWITTGSGPAVLEAHSTDYQLPESYPALVRDGFGILKVGPALTFALREALFALEEVEKTLVKRDDRSELSSVVEAEMLREPGNWISHYHGDEEQKHLLRVFSYSDRIRYYWNQPRVEASVAKLIRNLESVSIPPVVLSQFLPSQYRHVREGRLRNEPTALIVDRVRDVLRIYSSAAHTNG